MLKKIIFTIILMLMISSPACWFSQENFNKTYIAGVNFIKQHYDGKAQDLNSATFVNGQVVPLPITVWFKVVPRDKKYPIRIAKLYYKVVPKVNDAYDYNNSNYKWRLAKTIDMGNNPKWKMDFAAPVQLFGKAIITKDLIQLNGDTIKANDAIVFAWYFADTAPDALTNAQDITPGEAQPYIQPLNSQVGSKTYNNDYKPQHVMMVIYSGKKTVMSR